MRKFTAHVGLIELRTDQQRDVEYFIRRAGTKWEEVYGPITGRFIQEFLSPELEAQWRKLFDAVRDAQKPLRATAGIEYQDKRWLDAEMFTAPLGEDGVVKMLFMTFVAFSVSASA